MSYWGMIKDLSSFALGSLWPFTFCILDALKVLCVLGLNFEAPRCWLRGYADGGFAPEFVFTREGKDLGVVICELPPATPCFSRNFDSLFYMLLV